MSEQFDPYYTWLGIPPKEQPANFYRLLGLADFESNLDVIENAADRQMAHVRSFAGGQHADASQRLLNEISTAKVCLLAPDRKAEYDRGLPGRSGPKRKVPKAQPLEPEPRPLPKPAPRATELGIPKLDTGETSAAAALPQRRGQPKWVLPAVLGGGGLVVLIVIIAIAMSGDDDDVAQNSPRPAPPRPETSRLPVSSTPGTSRPGTSRPGAGTPAIPATSPLWNTPPTTEPPNTEPPTTEPPTTEPPGTEPPQVRPPATEPPAELPPGAIDLLATANLLQHVQQGQFRVQGNELTSADNGVAVLEFPQKLPDRFKLQAEVSHLQEAGIFGLGLRVGGRNCALGFNCGTDENSCCGLEVIEGQSYTEPDNPTYTPGDMLPQGKRVRIVVHVGKSQTGKQRVLAYADRRKLFDWIGDAEQITEFRRGGEGLMLMARGAFRLHRLTLEPDASEPPSEPPTSGQPAAVASRLPVPARAEVQDKINEVRKIFADDYAKAVTPELKAALGQALLGNAAKTAAGADASDLYALLSEARTLALSGGDSALALDAADMIAARFDVDAWKLKPETLQEAAKSAKSVAARLDVAGAASLLADEAFADEKYQLAIDLLRLSSAQALQAKDRGLAKQAADRRKEVERVFEQFKLFQAAQAKLAAEPGDAAAHLALGKHLCFLRSDWDEGIPHLVEGSNEELADLARADKASPVEGQQILALADRWSQWAETAGGDDKNGALIRAQYWYLQSLPRLTGIRKSRAAKRLADLAAEIKPIVGRRGLKLPWLEGQPGELRVIAAHAGEIEHLFVSPNGRLALTGEDKGARLWDLATGERVGEFTARDYTFSSVALAPDGRHVFAGTYDDRVAVLDAKTGAAKGTIRTPGSVYALDLSDDGKWLLWVCSYNEPSVGIWDIAGNRPAAAFHCPDGPNCAAFSPDGRKAAFGCDNAVRVFDLGSKQQVTELSTDGSSAYAIRFSPNGRYLASPAGGELRLWDVRRGSRIAILEDEYLTTSTLSFTPDGKRLLVADNRELLVVSVPDFAVAARIKLPETVRSYITEVACMPDPRGVVVTTADGKLRLLRLPDSAIAPR